MIKIIYNSPAMPQFPYDVQLGVSYECKKIKNKYFVKGLNFEREFTLDFIKRMFKPCDDYSWNMLEEQKKLQTNTKTIDTKLKTTKEHIKG